MLIILSPFKNLFKSHIRGLKFKRKMNVFTEKINPITGSCDWDMQDEEYDFHQEIARSSYADMLYDTERNQKYEAAIRIAIDRIHSFGKEANVLDIGTGTGLLSMMAAKHGADRIIACEVCSTRFPRHLQWRAVQKAFQDDRQKKKTLYTLSVSVFWKEYTMFSSFVGHLGMLFELCATEDDEGSESSIPVKYKYLGQHTPQILAQAFEPIGKCAESVIEKNGFASKITVIKKRSTDLKLGIDLPFRFNMLVTEVFDTELIGEGAICTFNHAHSELLESNSIVVPTSATIYAQVIESELASDWNKLKDFKVGDKTLIKIPNFINDCTGAAAVHDIQMSQLPLQSFRAVTTPQPVFRFDWTGKTRIRERRDTVSHCKSLVKGTAQAVFMWWDLVMDPFSQIPLSCAPYWAHPDVKSDTSVQNAADLIPWRDHWMQAVYYLPQEIPVEQNQEVTLVSSHDEFSLWFDLKSSKWTASDENSIGHQKNFCECGLHMSVPRARIGCLNDSLRRKKYYRALEKTINQDTVCLCLSDSSLMGVIAATLNPRKVYCLDSNLIFAKTLQKIVEHNNLQNKVQVFTNKEDLLSISEKVDLIIGEPHFKTATLPWHNLQFWHLANQFRSICSQSVKLLPLKVVISGLVVQFDHLWKIHAPLKTVEGFNTEPFDDLITRAEEISDNPVDAQPLWEYPCRALSAPFQVLQIDLSANASVSDSGSIHCLRKGTCHGVVLWADWFLDDVHIVSTGPLDLVNEKLVWDKHTKQGVYFFPEYQTISHSNKISYLALFQHKIPDVSFEFTLS